MGKYFYMTTSQGEELTLEKVDGKPGEYKIIPSRQADECPFGAQYGWRVQHITQEGQSFLAVRKPNGDVMWVLDQTTEKEELNKREKAIIKFIEKKIKEDDEAGGALERREQHTAQPGLLA